MLMVSSTLLRCGVAKNPPYLVEDFDQLTNGHKRIAILPYESYATWQMREKGKFNLWQEQLEVSGPYLQQKFFIAFAKNINKGKLDLAVQSFLITNEKLHDNHITYPTLKNIDKTSLGKLLDVDALVFCEYFDNSNRSTARPGVTSALDIDKNMLFTTSLFDGQSGKLLWRQNLVIPIQTRTDTKDRLAVKAINSFVKIFPYNYQNGRPSY